jgi:hypothetical protein
VFDNTDDPATEPNPIIIINLPVLLTHFRGPTGLIVKKKKATVVIVAMAAMR